MTGAGATRGHRVLLLTGTSFNRVNGGGITLSNLFAGWPRDRLAMIHCDSVPPSDEVCDRFYTLTGNEIRRLGPLLGMRPVVLSTLSEARGRRESAFAPFRAAKHLLFGNMLPDSGRLTPDLARWIDDFQPTVLYTFLGSNSMMDLSAAIRDRWRTKVALHFMDDWSSTVYRGGLFSFLARGRMRRLLNDMVSRANLRFGISPAMCRAYEARFGVPFVPFMNAVEPYPPRATPPASKEVLYIGSILPHAQLDSLIDACHAVATLRDRGIRLTILTSAEYVARYRSTLSIAPNISVAESPADETGFVTAIQSAAALLLPVNFDQESVDFIRYSMPTKVPAYLASGTPIIAYGPPNVAQIEYAREEGWAHVVDERNVVRLAQAVDDVTGNDALRRQLSARAVHLAATRHSLPVVRQAFQNAIATLA